MAKHATNITIIRFYCKSTQNTTFLPIGLPTYRFVVVMATAELPTLLCVCGCARVCVCVRCSSSGTRVVQRGRGLFRCRGMLRSPTLDQLEIPGHRHVAHTYADCNQTPSSPQHLCNIYPPPPPLLLPLLLLLCHSDVPSSEALTHSALLYPIRARLNRTTWEHVL